MEESKDDFKWFGEGFNGFPRGLPEDCVEYTIFVIDSKLRDDQIRQKLKEVQASANSSTRDLLKGFIWQRESFKLELAQEKGSSFLQGRTNYGDSVEDEWLIVYMLRWLSRQHRDIWIRVVDTDGQFLLIEAANHLPRWLNPEVANFRVWIHDGKLLIIPLEKTIDDLDMGKQPIGAATLQEAKRFLEFENSHLLHLMPVEKEAFYRVEKYPAQINDSLHVALITIPRKLAYVLHENETYISPATEAFYLRDPIALRPLQNSDYKQLTFPPEDLVTVSIKFTKIGYAQLRSQQFSVPQAWQKATNESENCKAKARAEMGMKVTCGFEMLMSDPQNKDKRQVREIGLLLEDVDRGECSLPSDHDITHWRQTEDNEGWLDVHFEDFQNELAGQKVNSGTDGGSGFGDKGAQDNLRRMVTKFEDFLQDEKAGLEGAEDADNSNDEESEEESEDDNFSQPGANEPTGKDIELNEKDFTALMKQIMGLSPLESQQVSKGLTQLRNVDVDSFSEDGSEGPMREEMRAIEQELRDAGALRLDSSLTPKDSASQPVHKDSKGYRSLTALSTPDGEASEELNIDTNLAENLLASLKGQAGLAGPGGNLVGLMGMQMPRDDDEESALVQQT